MQLALFSLTFLVAISAVAASNPKVSKELARELGAIENKEGKWFEDFDMNKEEEEECKKGHKRGMHYYGYSNNWNKN
eukprot:4807246-Ditylum_brightwellii.AAC.1